MNIKKIREDLSLSQIRLARLVNVSHKSISLYERGIKKCPKDIKDRILKINAGYKPFSSQSLVKKRKELKLTQIKMAELLSVARSTYLFLFASNKSCS